MLKLQTLEMSRPYTYGDEKPLKAKVTLQDADTGSEMTIALSPETIVKIINLIGNEVQRNASSMAKQVAGGLKASTAIESNEPARIAHSDD